MTETLEHSARLIAERGRDALITRLRPAFQEAASAHADVLELSPEQIEEMVQRAADRADGLQWRRALASVASEELGISLGEALTHPAVVRAQAIVGAPSYEDSLAELGVSAPARAPVADREPVPDAGAVEEVGTDAGTDEIPKVQEELHEDDLPEDEHEPLEDEQEPLGKDEHEPLAKDEHEPLEDEHEPLEDEHEPLDEDEPDEDEHEPLDEEREPLEDEHEPLDEELEPLEDEPLDDELEPLEEDLEPGELRLAAVHLGGIANLAPAESDLELHFSDDGLDIVRGTGHIFGRLRWEEITALDVPEQRGLLKRRRQQSAHLVIRSKPGDASFEIPALTAAELREQLEPLRSRLHA
jgi:hypothetical protein